MRRIVFGLVLIVVVAFSASDAWARVPVSLSGSPASMVRQHSVAEELDLIFVETPEEVEALVEEGKLVPLEGNADYTVLDGVSFPYAQPVVRIFIERLAAQYREGTGEKLVVTSLTRPTSMQPWNSHQLSVHPTGMAVDLRISQNAKSRAWLESVLLRLEKQNLLDITRERNPPHYHIALFPEAYLTHVEELIGKEALTLALTFPEPEPEPKDVIRPVAQRQPHVATVAVASETRDGKWLQFTIGLALVAALLAGTNYRQIKRRIARFRK